VRHEKPGLYAAIEKVLSLPNAKLFPVSSAAQQARLHHYACFNFKVSLIADEKRELILPLWMDVQRGCHVKGADIERTAILDVENGYANLPPAAAFWNNEPPLAPKTLSVLLERARQAVLLELGETLTPLQKRLARFLELDRARLNEYYADLRRDAERRLQKAEDDRRPVLEAKLAAIAAERESKLADVEHKYALRIQLELLNLAIIALPKLDLTVEIRKRTASVKRTASWNPLLHIVEPLACDVCEQSGATLYLCENGHLAHAECLAPQCVECKRTYCQKCTAEVQACAVCDRPLCVHSLVRCAECGRVTCHEHVGECHVEGGRPRRIALSQEKPVVTETGQGAKESAQKTEPKPKQKTTPKRETPKTRTSPIKITPPKPLADYIEVYTDPAHGTIAAYAMVKKRELAVRWWTMTEEGIAVCCNCEKGQNCRENNVVYRPFDDIERHMELQLRGFQNEYRVPDKKVRYFQVRQGRPFNELKLKVPSRWKAPAVIEQARAGFDKIKR
jgi:hypothetical protein